MNVRYADTCIVGEHLTFAGARGPYCGKCGARPLSTCAVCGGIIGFVECPTGSWWAHNVHPDDDHDAVTTEPQRVLCAHADRNGEGSHWLEPDETCALSQRTPSDANTADPSRTLRPGHLSEQEVRE